MEDLEDKTTAADAELEGGDRILVVPIESGAPLDVEADDEVLEAALVDSLGVGEPVGDHGRIVSDEGVDAIGVEVYIVEVVGIDGEFVIHYADLHGLGD